MWAVGVDLGGTKIEVARVDADGAIVDRLKFPTKVHGDPEATQAAIVEAVGQLLARTDEKPVGLGIGVAAQVAPEDGRVIFAPNLEWSDVPLQTNLNKALDLPVVVTNDVRAATWGEWLHGAGQGCDHLVCLFIGTGIGGGIVSGGQMLSGCGNSAGELGHIVVEINGPPCNCGGTGCMEAIAGGLSITRRARDAGLEIDNTRQVIDAYRDGDHLAMRLIEEAKAALAAGCGSIVNALNPCRLILGGGIVEGLPEIVDAVRDGIPKYALDAAMRPLEVVHAKLRNEAGTVGAASLAIKEFGS